MSELLESRWSDTKNALLEGLQGTKKAVMATTLENLISLNQRIKICKLEMYIS